MKSPSEIYDHCSKYGIWIVLNPFNKHLLNVKYEKIEPHPDLNCIEVHVPMGLSLHIENNTLGNYLYLSEYGSRWFCSRKEAITYCNRKIQGEI